MSVVTAVLLLTDLTDEGGGSNARLLTAVNAFYEDAPGLCSLTEYTGGTKHPQALIFGGGMNYLNEAAFLAFLRSFPWHDHGCEWAQVAMQGENDAGFGLVEVCRAHIDDAAWTEESCS